MGTDLGGKFWYPQQQDQLEIEKKEGGVLMDRTKKANVLTEAGPFASHWMVECTAFAKAKQVQTF